MHPLDCRVPYELLPCTSPSKTMKNPIRQALGLSHVTNAHWLFLQQGMFRIQLSRLATHHPSHHLPPTGMGVRMFRVTRHRSTQEQASFAPWQREEEQKKTAVGLSLLPWEMTEC